MGGYVSSCHEVGLKKGDMADQVELVFSCPACDQPPKTARCPVTNATVTGGAKCPLAHGTVYADPYPGYVHGRHPGICKHGCIPSMHPHPHESVKDKLLREALEFQELFHHEMGSPVEQRHRRKQEIMCEIEKTGTYSHTFEELQHGARVAWRNAPKCSNRKFWKELILIDQRHVTSNKGIWDACLDHAIRALKGGVTSTFITVFAPCTPGHLDGPKIWNDQLMRYAAHHATDSSVIGDPVNLDFTTMLKENENFQWKPKHIGAFDYLPVVVQGKEQPPEMFEFPETFDANVDMWHPYYPFIAEMKLKWYSVPLVCNLDLQIGGLTYTAAPFNGWYTTSEVVRDLADEHRYDILKKVAACMGLDTDHHDSFWRDEALAVLHKVVLHSFSHAKRGIVDHHTLIRGFYQWYKSEMKFRGYCPGNWKWIIPPYASSQSQAYLALNKMTEYTLKPAFVYGMSWKACSEKCFGRQSIQRRTRILRVSALICLFIGKLKVSQRRVSPKILIAYASVSGNARKYAALLDTIVSHTCRVQLVDLESFAETGMDAFSKLVERCHLLVLMSSTHGDGEVPQQGKALESSLEKGTFDLKQKPYVVLGFGSSNYPKFCEGGKRFDRLLEQCNGMRLHSVGTCDAMSNERAQINEFCLSVLSSITRLCISTKSQKFLQFAEQCQNNFYAVSAPTEPTVSIEAVSEERICQKGRSQVMSAIATLDGSESTYRKPPRESPWLLGRVLEVKPLVGNASIDNMARSTVLVRLSTAQCQVPYKPGDHVMVMPPSKLAVCQNEIQNFCRCICLNNAPLDPDQVFIVHGDGEALSKEKYALLHEIIEEYITPTTLFTSIAGILDPISMQDCLQLAKIASGKDRAELQYIGSKPSRYDEELKVTGLKWVNIFQRFASLTMKIPFLFMLSHIPLNHARYYSISSAKSFVGDEIHLTVGRRIYKSEDGKSHLGVASNFLSLCEEGQFVKFKVRSMPSFHMPMHPEDPVLMIATGSGIASFRGFWQERLTMGEKLAPMTVVFGCRCRSEAEFFFMDELIAATEQGILKTFHAYSREPGQPKQYVQDLLTAQAAYFSECLSNNRTHIYVCGGASIATEVKEALAKINKSGFQTIEQSGNYHEDIFGVFG